MPTIIIHWHYALQMNSNHLLLEADLQRDSLVTLLIWAGKTNIEVRHLHSLTAAYRSNLIQDAISQANKAQVCLDEFFRVTEPYFYILPQDKAAVYNSLKKDGVKQVAVICDLLYNGSSVTTSVRSTSHLLSIKSMCHWCSRLKLLEGSVQTLVEKQESVFESLTCLAVHIQELVPKYEQNERNARASRDELRKQLADIWKREQPTLSTITTWFSYSAASDSF